MGRRLVTNYRCVAAPGSGNTGIARRLFKEISNVGAENIGCVVVMWSFLSRYDWAMPRHRDLENTRWTNISPWDTKMNAEEMHSATANSEPQQAWWKKRRDLLVRTGVGPFADALYRHAANQYHEIYLSWKSIVWLQNILEKKNIPYLFTLADNSLFYEGMKHHQDEDALLRHLHAEIDLSKWYFFGERCMGFNQWALLNDYERGTTHPLDVAHADAVNLIEPMFKKITGGKNV